MYNQMTNFSVNEKQVDNVWLELKIILFLEFGSEG